MLKKRFFIPLVVMSMIFTACGGGTGSNEPSADSSQPADSTSQPAESSATSKPAESSASSSKTSAPTSQSSAPASSSSSSAAPVHNHDYELVANSTVKNADDKDVYVKECKDHDDKYIGIAFDDYSEKSADFGSTSSYNNVPEDLRNESRLLAKNSTITWKFNLDKAVSGAKLAFGVVYTGSDHGTQTGSDGSTVKYSIKANSGDFVDWALGTTTYDEAGFSQTARSYFTFGTIDLVEGENTITLRQNNAGYRLLYGGEVRIHFSGDAKPVEAPVPFEGYNVTFVTEHCKVLVYSTKAYETETPVETNTCKAKDEEGNIVAYDPDDIELQPQVSFKVVCDNGYSATVNNVTVTPRENYKNLKQNPDSVDGQDDIFRITKVQGDITVTIAPSQGEQAPGYKVTFVPTNCAIKVYVGPKNADGTNLDTPQEGGFYYARAKDGTYEVSYTTPQVNFEVVCDSGYEFVPTITDNKVDFITRPDTTKDGYNKFSDKGGYYNLTKVDDDLTITITATSTGGQDPDALSEAVVLNYSALTGTGSEISADDALAKIGQGNAHITAVTASKIYDGNGTSGAYPNTAGLLKTGTGSAAGKIVFTLDVDVAKVEISCHDWYKKNDSNPTNSNTVAVNGSATQLAPYNEEGTFGTLTFELAEGSKEITIDVNKRIFIKEIKLS